MSRSGGVLNMSGHIHVMKTKRLHVLIHTGPLYTLKLCCCYSPDEPQHSRGR